jgi:Type II restriction endonuclease EcoO109I
MKQLNLKDVTQYVEENIGIFHQKRIASLDKLKLREVLRKKNPYLFKAKYILTVEEIIKSITDAHISSSEETIFGDWLEGLAIFINSKVYDGWKSGIPGIDLEFDLDNIRYILNIKSGPKWHNKSQKEKMLNEFTDAKKTLATSNSKIQVIAINGCCYGRDNKPHKFPKKGTDYLKLCGQRFWEFVSGDTDLYTKIIDPLGHQARERNDDFIQSYAQMINKFTKEFADTFCMDNGAINWDKLVCFNSATIRPKK